MADVMEAPAKKEIQSKASRAGLTFAVSRVEKKIRQSRLAKRVGVESYIYMTGVVEAVVHDLLSKADAHAAGLEPPAKRMTNQHVLAAARSDPDLARLFSGFCFTSSANVPKAVEHILDKEQQEERKEQQEERKVEKERRAAEKKAQENGNEPMD
jgi:histone H2A